MFFCARIKDPPGQGQAPRRTAGRQGLLSRQIALGIDPVFFCLSSRLAADYLSRPMWSSSRSAFIVLLSAAAAFAQEAPVPTPTPEATPAAEATPESATTPETSAAPTSEPVPPPPLPPADATPSSTPDIIPLTDGAPLETQDLAPSIDQAMPDDAFTAPNAVIPDEAPPPVARALDNAQEKLRLQNIRYKEVRIQVEKDPKVKSLYNQSVKAKTPEDQRAALREYYRLLFKKMIAVDSSLEGKCRAMEDAYLRRLVQERLEPTIPLNPPPTPEPLD
jgi:hypothetical protein